MSCRNKEISLYIVVHKIAMGISDHGQVRIQHILFKYGITVLNLNHTKNGKCLSFFMTCKSLVNECRLPQMCPLL